MRHVGTNYFRLVISYLSGNTHVLAIDKNFEFPWKLENRTFACMDQKGLCENGTWVRRRGFPLFAKCAKNGVAVIFQEVVPLPGLHEHLPRRSGAKVQIGCNGNNILDSSTLLC